MVERPAAPRTMLTARSAALGERLLAEKRITSEQHELAVAHQRAAGCRIEDALIEVEAVSEPDLLKYLASIYRTRFVSTERLSKADIDRATLDKVPKKLADRLDVLPVLFDAATNTLSIVTADPHNADALEQVQKGAGVREVKALLGRPAAVHAAVSKFYRGDPFAFTSLENKPKREMALDLRLSAFPIDDVQPEIPRAPRVARDPRAVLTLGALDMPAPQSSRPSGAPPAPRASVPNTAGADGWSTSEAFIETVSVLVSLLENGREGLRGHSGHVARLTRKMTERIGLPIAEANALVVAAHLHDLGKGAGIHLTALNVAQLEAARVAAQKCYATPARLMASARLAIGTTQALDGMYERYDGRGFPNQVEGKQIPLGARLIAIIDSFLDLTDNPKNARGTVLDPSAACELLAKDKGSVFDADLLDLFRATVTGDDQKARMLVNRHVAVVIDADFEETTVLELRMIQEGFDVRIARTFSEARLLLERGGVELVVSELDLSPDPSVDSVEGDLDGLAFLAEARRTAWGSDVAWLVLTRRAGHDAAQRALALGAIDYVIKPAITDVLVAKLKNAVQTRKVAAPTRGISGSLGEMSLADVVQVLWHGRKSGALRLRRGAESGEVHITEGRVVNAVWGKLQAEEAFYAMLRIGDGDFSLDPNYKAEEVRITAAPETLLLEGMRRMDEA